MRQKNGLSSTDDWDVHYNDVNEKRSWICQAFAPSLK